MSSTTVAFHPRFARLVLGLVAIVVFAMLLACPAKAQSRHLAPGFSALPSGASLVVMAPDVELFSISGGGVLEPRADWTEAAQGHIDNALVQQMSSRAVTLKKATEEDADEFHEISALHAAVAGSISLHHMTGGSYALPTKNGQLDWSLGDAVIPLRDKMGTDYALFVWMRDSYASNERKAAMIAMAILGVGLVGGSQVGYASLIDLRTGQIMWFNRLLRGIGDLRDADSAAKTIRSLLADFPTSK